MSIMRNHFTVGLAGYLIEVDSISPRACILCMDYLMEGNPDCRVKITEEDVRRELLDSVGISSNAISLENAAVYRKITEKLLAYGVILMHGAVIGIGDSAYMFSAPSGTGKTTHIRLWLRNINDSYVINGDKPLIKIESDRIIACGTPWSGNENMNTNTMKPLKAIVFLERSDSNYIEELSFPKAYPYLLRQTYLPNNPEKAKKVLELLSQIYKKTTFWRFHCNNFKEDCFRTAYNALIEGKDENTRD